jgi:HlyD family secretion protein
MKRGLGWLIVLLAVAGAAGGAWVWLRPQPEIVAFKTGAVARQDVKATVSSTGTLQAVTTVEVGTQVSGVVAELLVDFNDHVEQGRVIARIDPTLLTADLASTRATLSVREAERDKAAAELRRLEELVSHGTASDQELVAAKTASSVAIAQVRLARVAVERAEHNLSYATITSPVTGTVLERAVEAGQTVNAGMTAPRLFLLAGDLAAMQIKASVDEADIGKVAVGQPVSFNVRAFDEATFTGKVGQVRLQSALVEGVVTYTVMIDVPNADLRLLPGMTATVDFVVQEVPAALCVPNAALRFKPEPGQIAGAEGEAAAPAGPPAGGPPGGGPPGGGPPGAGRKRGGRGGGGVIWLAEGADKVRALPVQTGPTDGTCTVVTGDGVEEGLTVVTGVERAAAGEGGGGPLAPKATGSQRPGGF